VPLFYEGAGSGKVRAMTHINNVSADVTVPGNGVLGSSRPLYLDDIYEGELMVLFMDLQCEWAGYPDNGAVEKALIWRRKQHKLVAVNYSAGELLATVQEGFWFSSHEQWKTLVLPYLDIPRVRDVFENCERARLHNSAWNSIPGLFASASPPLGVECGTGYCGATGVQQVGSMFVEYSESVTPYGAYPSILVHPSAGLAWYAATLALPRMQTQHGSVESSNLDGTSIASILTWDAKITTVLAMLGGTSQLMKEYLTQDALLDRFTQLITEFYETEFGKDPLPGNGEPFAMPSTKLPSGARPESWSCACAPTTLFS